MRPGRTVSRMFLIAGLVLCCLGSAQIAAAGINTWTSVGPEGGAIVEVVLIDPTTPTTLYAATLDGGVFKSTDGGGRWTAANTGLTVTSVRTFAIDPTTPSILYAGTAGDGVFKSTDAGNSWSAANAGLEFTDVFGLAIDPTTTPTTLYVGTSSGFVFKSTDGGGNWSAVFDSGGAAVQGLAIDPRKAPDGATTIYAGTHGPGVFKSTNGGEPGSWNPVNTGMIDDAACSSYGYNCYAFVGDVTIDPQNPDTLYAEAWTADIGFQELISFVFKTTNGGLTWSPVLTVPIDSHVQGVTIDPQNPKTLYAVTGDHTGVGAVFKSTDGGDSWSDLSTGLTGVSRDVRALAVDPLTSAILYAGTYGRGVFVFGKADPPDTTPPGTSITSAIDGNGTTLPATTPATTPSTSLTLTFTGTDDREVARFECQLNGAGTGFSPCTSPKTYTGLTTGQHTFDVRAIDTSDNPDPTPARYTWTVVDAPPDTTITAATGDGGVAVPDQASTLSTSITVTFTGKDDRGVARFECQLDGEGFGPCTSPWTKPGLPPGRHTFDVRAIDTSNNADPSPARFTWTVDVPPDTSVSAVDARGRAIANGGITTSRTITFGFTGKDNGTVTGFECRLDAANFTMCVSPLTYTSVSRGTHTFQVRALDNNGFRDPTPAIFKWTRTNND